MSKFVLMYATTTCSVCARARELLRAEGVEFTEILVDREPGRRAEMVERSGSSSVPQVFIGEHHVGGFDDLSALDQEGALERLLKG